jgi:serine/threonine protein kinase
VRFCSHRKTRKEFAVKSIPQNVAGKNSALLRNEVSILQQIKHKNVVRLVDLMQDDRFIHIVMEKCQGGDLFDKIMKDRVTFGEKIVSQIIRNVLDALEYLHERHIVHRDLKVSLKLLIYWLRASILLHCVSSMYCRLNT